MNHGFVKISAATPSLQVADCIHNANEVIHLFRKPMRSKRILWCFQSYA